MSKYISSNEFKDTIYDFYSPFHEREIGKKKIFEEYGDIQFKYFSTANGMTLTYFNAVFFEDTIFESFDSDSFSFISFNMGEDLLMKNKKDKKMFKISSNVACHGRQLETNNSISCYAKNKLYSSCHITFENDLFDELNICKDKKDKLTKILDDSIILNSNNYINSKEKVLLKEIFDSPFEDNKLQEIYLESKLLNLTHISISNIQNKIDDNKVYFSSQDMESLKKAKQILIENISNPPSLKELAYKSAINEYKLKKGFKQYFGNTVYGFLQEFRLNEAKDLLENNEINIGEACNFVGYKSISHFSKIFKQYFGINPMEIKKNQKKVYI